MEKKLDLRIEKTYLFLHNAFTTLLEEKRFEDFTVNELCERAMIRRTTFYKHFADKYEYFAFYIKEICAQFQDQLPPDVTADSTTDYLLYMCRELLRFLDKHERMVKNVMNSTLFPVLMDSMTEQMMRDTLPVLRRIDSLSWMSNAQLEGIAAFYSGGMSNTLRLALKQGKKIDEEEFIATVSGFLKQKI